MKIKTLEEQLADPYYDDADQFIDDESPEWTDEEEKKVSVTIRYSSKVIDAFKATGKGWQSRMNQVLEDYVAKSM